MGYENRGKQFESIIREAFLKVPGTSVIRLPDPTNGFMGVRNICDYIVYHYPKQYFIECKCTHENVLSIYGTNPDKKYGKITNNQWEGLLEQSSIPGVVAGVIIWFILKKRTVFFPIQVLEGIRNCGYKSISSELISVPYFDIPARQKRVFCDYNMRPFFDHWDIMTKERINEGMRAFTCYLERNKEIKAKGGI